MRIDRNLFLVLAASISGSACGGYAPPPQDPSDNEVSTAEPTGPAPPATPPRASHITSHEAEATPPRSHDQGEFHPSGEGFHPSGEGFQPFGEGFKPFGDGSSGHPSNEGSD